MTHEPSSPSTSPDLPAPVRAALAQLEDRCRLDVQRLMGELHALDTTLRGLTQGLASISDDVVRLAQVVDGIAAKVTTRH